MKLSQSYARSTNVR